MFFRESCYVEAGDREKIDCALPSGEKKENSSPSHLREIGSYFAILDKVQCSQNGKNYKLQCERCASLKTCVDLKRNYGQIYWLLTKVGIAVRYVIIQLTCTGRSLSRT